jgi:hypothetical protein
MFSHSFIYLWYTISVIILFNKLFLVLPNKELILIISSMFGVYAYCQCLTIPLDANQGIKNIIGSVSSMLILAILLEYQ